MWTGDVERERKMCDIYNRPYSNAKEANKSPKTPCYAEIPILPGNPARGFVVPDAGQRKQNANQSVFLFFESKISIEKDGSPILINLRAPAVLNLIVHLSLPLRFAHLHLEAFPSTEDLALQVEATPFLGVIEVKQLLKPFYHHLGVGLASLRSLDIEDPTCLIEPEAVGGERVGARNVSLARLRGIPG
jgi:hypothetical protein